jgi:tRNA nucleotidyltransferase/poly(A) polymerase
MPDYMFLLESRLSAEQRAVLTRMQELGVATESNVYLAGGAVRDLISGMPIRDLDFAVEGNPFRIVRELEKGGARVVHESERMRFAEMIFAGDVDGSIAAARDEVYARPGTTPEVRWSTIMEDLRRRDFSFNAIAISLNPASRGLLLDPTNGLSDLERHEIRALSIHSFTNQPVRLLRVLRFAARLGAKLETRTKEWFDLAIERQMNEQIQLDDAGSELRQLTREDKPVTILKAWEASGLLGAFSPHLARRHPDYDAVARLARARDDLMSGNLRPRLLIPGTLAVLGKLKSREVSAALHNLKYSAAEIAAILKLEAEGKKFVKILAGRKMNAPRDAYTMLEVSPLDMIAYVMAESPNTKARAKIRNYIQKWRPMRLNLPAVATELETLGMARGPKFDKVVEQFFAAQLAGKGKTPEDRLKLLRRLSGIKELPKKPIKEEKKKPVKAMPKGAVRVAAQPAAAGAGAKEKTAAPDKAGAAKPPAAKATAHPPKAAHAMKAKPAKKAAKPAHKPSKKKPAKAKKRK